MGVPLLLEDPTLPTLELQRECLRRWLIHVTRDKNVAATITGESLVRVCTKLEELERRLDTQSNTQ